MPGSTATVIGLYGDLGSGKTAFVKAVAKRFGVLETVTSPTFVLEKIYKLSGQIFSHLIHIDAYRLEEARELKQLGFSEPLKDPGNVIFIEWAERVEELLPKGARRIKFAFIDETTRDIQIE
jgi:tRNA threonylcarbamoyladenosine biosynthesis protein TsaE